jgi:hypothetical protein
MPGDRPHEVSHLTSAELERARRDLQISLALAFPGSPVRVPILEELSAIDRELAARTTIRPDDREGNMRMAGDNPLARTHGDVTT